MKKAKQNNANEYDEQNYKVANEIQTYKFYLIFFSPFNQIPYLILSFQIISSYTFIQVI